MTLPSSGTISLNQIHVEAGGSSGSTASINDSDIRVLIGKSSEASMSFNEWYGASREITLPSLTAIFGYDNNSDITASGISGLTAGGTLIIPEDFYLWSSSTGAAALIIDLASITVQNSGFIVGKGGGGPGGPAISITASGVTIINNSGAYIAGGGGSGAQGRNGGPGFGAGGGGGPVTPRLGQNGLSGTSGSGGGAGGGAAAVSFAGGLTGGQGGYVLPGSGGAAGNSYSGVGGAGGSAGGNGTHYGNDGGGPLNGSGGGGGWGAAGGSNGLSGSVGGAGGKGIEANGNSFTLTNNGTIYGAQS